MEQQQRRSSALHDLHDPGTVQPRPPLLPGSPGLLVGELVDYPWSPWRRPAKSFLHVSNDCFSLLSSFSGSRLACAWPDLTSTRNFGVVGEDLRPLLEFVGQTIDDVEARVGVPGGEAESGRGPLGPVLVARAMPAEVHGGVGATLRVVYGEAFFATERLS
ncbi:hypothetical protein HPP92_022306 [Vanilla planifolia]|uniref:Uncharacterized protein n=1 Tax=Vanilla planifolia TaxID=51239 RepID=A0A835PUI2_VANPL|nr:hypothetical protein HPP92_022306 [Vanilla planifolia]